MLFPCFLVFDSFSKIPNQRWFSFQFFTLTKCPKNDFFNLETLTSCRHIQHITLHKNFVFLAVTNLKYKNYTSFYKFLLLLSGDVSLNPGSVQRSPDISPNIWEPLNKKGLHFLHISINSLLSKKDEIRCIANKTKAAIIGITESKLDHTVPDSEVNFPGYDILRCDRNKNGGGLLVTLGRISASTQELCIAKKLKILFLTFFYLSRKQLLYEFSTDFQTKLNGRKIC